MIKKDLKKIAKEVRLSVLEMISRTKTAHIGSSSSAIEILISLYFEVLNVDPGDPSNPNRDRFILSKGHAAAGLYATLAAKGFIEKEDLNKYYANGSFLPGHVSRGNIPGIEASTGSLGHGLPIGTGMAWLAKKDGRRHRVFVLLSDGECDEGSTWEAVLFAGHHRLDNLVAIIDYNKWQSFGRTEDILDLEPLAEKWRAFNWSVREVDGHDVERIVSVLKQVPFEASRPSAVIAHTVKGKGLPSLEDKLESHYLSPSTEEIEKIKEELNRQ